jgi:RimJ/RimL family protein N-acetyltransferase
MTLDLQAPLSNNVVTLTPLREDDYDALFMVASDPLIWAQHPASDRWKPDVFRAFFDGAIASKGAYLIRDSDTDEVIGSSRFHAYDPETRVVEIGWTFFKRSHWGGCYNGATKKLMLTHAFGFVDHVILYAGQTNHRSRKAIERIGGVQIGVREEAETENSFRYQVTPAGYAQSSSNR